MQKMIHCACTERCADVAPLVLRIATGLVFFIHGYTKLTTQGVPGVSEFLGSLGFPAPDLFAIVLLTVEIVGGIALIAGLFTHWAAKLTGIVAIVALVLVHVSNGFFVQNGGYEFVLLLIAALVSIMVTGPGKYSLDHHWLKKHM
ncbi:MAG: DoxX family protein [Parcubacteria group bacterium]|nr:DoxX family protein [Parcubacteria group bacterium]